MDTNFAESLWMGLCGVRKPNADPVRGLVNGCEEIPEMQRHTAAQKVTHLELMLGQIANYCPVILEEHNRQEFDVSFQYLAIYPRSLRIPNYRGSLLGFK